MPSRKVPFVNGECYHIFNRGVAKIPIFDNSRDYQHFIKTMIYYQIEGPKPRFSICTLKGLELNHNKKIINILGYCLMPNHFHLLIQQIRENGITEFMSKLSNSYTKYFNIKNRRIGPLLQGEFKSVYIEKDEQLIHLLRYIHLNPLVGYKTKNLEEYPWSSYLEYTELSDNNICLKEIVINQFKSVDEFKSFTHDQEDYGQKLEMLKHELLDLPQV
ncbi:hypothetical protein C4559_04760 [Candidatus Microgenomates bacterium]|nr:MAG: hypothetical protein C4559_04760 [Candidatus Microgenomates bacterium]